jgi:hypothetical protein
VRGDTSVGRTDTLTVMDGRSRHAASPIANGENNRRALPTASVGRFDKPSESGRPTCKPTAGLAFAPLASRLDAQSPASAGGLPSTGVPLFVGASAREAYQRQIALQQWIHDAAHRPAEDNVDDPPMFVDPVKGGEGRQMTTESSIDAILCGLFAGAALVFMFAAFCVFQALTAN